MKIILSCFIGNEFHHIPFLVESEEKLYSDLKDKAIAFAESNGCYGKFDFNG